MAIRSIRSEHSKYKPRTYNNSTVEEIIENAIPWWGGIDSSVLCKYIKMMCPCIDAEANRLLIMSINDIYKQLYYYDLLSNIDEINCGCVVICGNDNGESLLENKNLDKNELYLIRTIIQLFCRLGIKRMLTIDDLNNSEYKKNGLLPHDFNLEDLADEARYKYLRQLHYIAFYRSGNDFREEHTIAFYMGVNGIQFNNHYINFYIGESTKTTNIITNEEHNISVVTDYPNDIEAR